MDVLVLVARLERDSSIHWLPILLWEYLNHGSLEGKMTFPIEGRHFFSISLEFSLVSQVSIIDDSFEAYKHASRTVRA